MNTFSHCNTSTRVYIVKITLKLTVIKLRIVAVIKQFIHIVTIFRTDTITRILLTQCIENERDQLQRIFICMMPKFQLAWLMQIRIADALVKLVFPPFLRFQNGTKNND
jgi:hypothetical protein